MHDARRVLPLARREVRQLRGRSYGANGGDTDAAMRMGALLAVPPSVNIATWG